MYERLGKPYLWGSLLRSPISHASDSRKAAILFYPAEPPVSESLKDLWPFL